MKQQLAQLAVDAAMMVARGEPEVFDLVAERTAELFGADGGVGFSRWWIDDDGAVALRMSTGGVPPLPRGWQERAKELAPHTPTMFVFEQVGVREPVRISDVLELRRIWGTEAFEHMHGVYQGRYPLGAAVIHEPDEMAFIGLHRVKRDFDDADVADFRQFQRVLAQAFAFRHTLDDTVRHLRVPRQRRAEMLPWTTRSIVEEYVPTRREAEVLALTVDGWTNQQIGNRLGISERTVRKHLSAVYEQAGLAGRSAAAAWWHSRGYGRN